MAIKGLATPVFGEYNYNGSAVTYTNGFIAGSAIEYGVEVETSDNNPLYGDDHIIENDYGTFNSGTLTLNTSDLDQYTSKRLLGLKEVEVQVGEVQVTELVTDDDAKQTPKGFGIIETHQINDVDKYRAVILCKVAMSIPAEAATTKGESIEWQTKEIEGTVNRSDENTTNYKHPWKREAWFDTHAEAMEYLKTMLNALEEVTATSAAGSSAGQTVITIINQVEGATYKYSTDGPVKTYKQDLTSWTALTPGEAITVSNGATVYIAQADSTGKAVGAGSVKAIVNEE
mgnify:CR=1 FL=1